MEFTSENPSIATMDYANIYLHGYGTTKIEVVGYIYYHNVTMDVKVKVEVGRKTITVTNLQ